MIIKPSLGETVHKLKAKITKLEADKELLRVYLHELIEAFYKTVNGNKETSSNWTSDLEQLFKNLKQCVKCSNLTNQDYFGQVPPCFLSNLKDIICHQKDIGEPNCSKKGGQHE